MQKWPSTASTKAARLECQKKNYLVQSLNQVAWQNQVKTALQVLLLNKDNFLAAQGAAFFGGALAKGELFLL